MRLTLNHHSFLADTLTPVGIFLTIRDQYHHTFLLESSDYHGNDHKYSYVGFEPIAEYKVENDTIHTSLPMVLLRREKLSIESK